VGCMWDHCPLKFRKSRSSPPALPRVQSTRVLPERLSNSLRQPPQPQSSKKRLGSDHVK
jgi:hypothetical protein